MDYLNCLVLQASSLIISSVAAAQFSTCHLRSKCKGEVTSEKKRMNGAENGEHVLHSTMFIIFA
jgi:hypothetical protein